MVCRGLPLLSLYIKTNQNSDGIQIETACWSLESSYYIMIVCKKYSLVTSNSKKCKLISYPYPKFPILKFRLPNSITYLKANFVLRWRE